MKFGAPAASFASSVALFLAVLVPTACGSSDDSTAAPAATADGGDPAVTEGGTPGTDGAVTPPRDGALPDAAPQTHTCTGKLGVAGDKPVTLMVGGKARDFLLHVPATYDPAKRTPLAFVFHGYTMTAAQIATASHFAATADKHGMIAAFPNGLSSSFNAGDCCGLAQTDGVDDVAFTSAMIAALDADYCVDAKRVFSAGFSNGGFLSYRLACELSDKIAAIAPVAGGLRLDVAACAPKRPVPVLHIHGTGDLLVPYNGGVGTQPVSYSIDAFKAKNGCAAGAGKVVFTKDPDVSCTKWDGCTAGADVELCTVAGGGHQWPGGDTLPYGGSASPNLDSSETIAAFFDAHPML
jgi:polyhydroxybutyrate depolymerase